MAVFQLVSIAKIDPVKKLLRQAAAEKKSGDIENAITTLHEAYKEISRTSVNCTIDPFLKLPLYLQQASHSNEAWREFNRLLVEGYPNQLRSPGLMSMDHAIIYDKMRLFLQREQCCQEAVKYGIFSHLLWGIGLHRQGRKQELRSHLSRHALKTMLQELLKKAKKDDLSIELYDLLERHLKTFPNINFPLLSRNINSITFQ